MMQLGGIGFAAPWLLAGLLALPILWWLLRATPPAPLRERFPGVVVLLGLEPPERTPQRTPWWLLLLRLLVAALVILAFAQPLLNPRDRLAGEGPVHLILDGGWASAPDWDDRIAAALELADRADRADRPVRLDVLAGAGDERLTGEVLPAPEARARIEALRPRPWAPDRAALAERVEDAAPGETVIWLHDGLDHDGEGERLAAALAGAASLRLLGPERLPRAVIAAPPEGATLAAIALRASGTGEATAQVIGFEAEPDGARRALALAAADFAEGEDRAEAVFEAPLELRNRISILALDGEATAGATALIDDRWRRKRVGLVSGERPEGGQRLLSGAHYVREALSEVAELREGTVADLLEQNVDAIILVDVGAFPEGEAEALLAWVEGGGLVVRFAGPTLAATAEEARAGFGRLEDPLLPVRLRPGGRDLGGAMSWGSPQRLAPFGPDSPFFGLVPPEDAAVNRQVLAEPDIDLPTRTWASLADGAPLVTADARGDGRVVLIHTAADPRWSSLPLSGLFVDMLDRIVKGGTGGEATTREATGLWAPVALVGADGSLRPAPPEAKRVEGEAFAFAASAEAPPGLYEAVGEDGARHAHNVLGPEPSLVPLPPAPAGVATETLGQATETELKPWLLAAALALLLIDAIVSLALAGRLRPRAGAAAAMLALAALAVPGEARAQAQDDAALAQALRAGLDGAFGYVETGDPKTDELAKAALTGLALTLNERTSVEPPLPVGVDLEADELAVYPFLLWAISPSQATPSDEAIAKLNDYMRRGGLLMIDTRDANLMLASGETPGTRALQRLTEGLDLPPLSPVPEGHVLRRTFYLLDDFPGRWGQGRVWVEAAPAEDLAEAAASGGFKNDGVSPVIVGGRDWVGAWAVDNRGRPMLPMGAGGERAREMARRFGVNLIMYAYTGSYKSDQVHIPALLDRLGQ